MLLSEEADSKGQGFGFRVSGLAFRVQLGFRA